MGFFVIFCTLALPNSASEADNRAHAAMVDVQSALARAKEEAALKEQQELVGSTDAKFAAEIAKAQQRFEQVEGGRALSASRREVRARVEHELAELRRQLDIARAAPHVHK